MHRMREFIPDLLFSGIDVIGRQNCRNLERLNHLNGLGTPALPPLYIFAIAAASPVERLYDIVWYLSALAGRKASRPERQRGN